MFFVVEYYMAVIFTHQSTEVKLNKDIGRNLFCVSLCTINIWGVPYTQSDLYSCVCVFVMS